MKLASIFAVLLATSTAGASPITGTMCGKFFPSASGCGGSSGVEANNFDASLQVWPSASGSRGLLVFFHGHGGSPTSATDFQSYAMSLGYDVISLDYAYGRDYPQKTTGGASWSPADASCAYPASDGTCGMSLSGVCGCYSDCYGYRWRSIWQGGSYTGLPTVSADWTIDSRLAHVISYMRDHGYPRFGNYLANGAPSWPSITIAGHSLGASLVGYIAKWQQVRRVIMMSGTGDTLAPHTDLTTWGDAYGCDLSGSAGCNGVDGNDTYTFAGCTCKHTTYSYGGANNLGYCTLSTDAPGWITDRYENDGGTVWATPATSFYGFEDSDDKTCNWLAPDSKVIMTQRNWFTMGVGAQFVTGAGLGPIHLSSPSVHGVVVMDGTTPAQICDGNGVSGHNATVVANVCTTSTDDANRTAIYDFMLTN